MAKINTFVKGRNVSNPNDKVMTPEKVAKEIIDMLPIGPDDRLYDPFRGDGAFYNNFPKPTKGSYATITWSEIDHGRDFFKWENGYVDWIISNPPYSIYDKVMEHSMEMADNIVYLVPLSKVVSSMGRIRKIDKYGGVKQIYIIGASKCGFPFGFPACAIWIQRGYKGETKIIVDKAPKPAKLLKE